MEEVRQGCNEHRPWADPGWLGEVAAQSSKRSGEKECDMRLSERDRVRAGRDGWPREGVAVIRPRRRKYFSMLAKNWV